MDTADPFQVRFDGGTREPHRPSERLITEWITIVPGLGEAAVQGFMQSLASLVDNPEIIIAAARLVETSPGSTTVEIDQDPTHFWDSLRSPEMLAKLVAGIIDPFGVHNTCLVASERYHPRTVR